MDLKGLCNNIKKPYNNLYLSYFGFFALFLHFLVLFLSFLLTLFLLTNEQLFSQLIWIMPCWSIPSKKSFVQDMENKEKNSKLYFCFRLQRQLI